MYPHPGLGDEAVWMAETICARSCWAPAELLTPYGVVGPLRAAAFPSRTTLETC